MKHSSFMKILIIFILVFDAVQMETDLRPRRYDNTINYDIISLIAS